VTISRQNAADATLTATQLIMLVFGRFVFNTAFRLVYPLLAFIADGFAVNAATASLLVTVQVGATLLSPLGGTLADRRGERETMVWGAVLFIIGTLIAAFSRDFLGFLGGYTVIGIATALYMPAMQAYASERSRYSERARVLGILEFSWAFAALFGVTALAAVVEATQGWAAALSILSAAGVITLAMTWTLPADSRRHNGERPAEQTGSLLLPLQVSGARGALIFAVIAMFAIELIFLSYAAWLSDDFGLTTQQLGLIFGGLGLLELAGSVAATLFTDRIGKRRAVLGGFGAVGIILAVLPFTHPQLAPFLIGLLLFDLCFEFAIVSFFPLVSGLTAQGRGALMAMMVAVIGLARISASLSGPWLVELVGYSGNSWTAAALALLAVVIGLRSLREGRH
jgi:predicted MFS family arabinose efflux permease